MQANVGSVDRVVRVVVGLGLIAFGVMDHTPWRYVGIAGAVLVLTALVGSCPAYMLFGIRTCSRPAVSH